LSIGTSVLGGGASAVRRRRLTFASVDGFATPQKRLAPGQPDYCFFSIHTILCSGRARYKSVRARSVCTRFSPHTVQPFRRRGSLRARRISQSDVRKSVTNKKIGNPPAGQEDFCFLLFLLLSLLHAKRRASIRSLIRAAFMSGNTSARTGVSLRRTHH